MTVDRVQDGRQLTVLAAIMVVVCALYWPTVAGMAAVWEDTDRTTYTHGFLVVLVCLWLLWDARREIAVPGSASVIQRGLALMALLGCALAWQLSYRAGIQLAGQVLLPLILWLCTLALLGARAARASLPGFAYLYFALPVWDYLNPLAQGSSVRVVRLMLRLTGVPAYFDDNLVTVPSGTFEIAGGCSGLHFIIVAVALAVLVGVVRNDSWRLRLRWLVIALLLALVTNWVRVYSVILAGHLSHMQHYLVRTSHYGFGWVLFAVAIAIFFLIVRRTPEGDPPPPAESASLPVPARQAAWNAALMLVVALPWLLNRLVDFRSADAALNVAVARAVDWQPVAGADDAWQPIQENADRVTRTRFGRGDARVELFVAEYREQHQGKELGGYDNRLGGDAAVLSTEAADAELPAYGAMLTERRGQRAVIWYTYEVEGRRFRAPLRAQLWYSWLTLINLRSPESKVIAARAACDSTCEGASENLRAFVRQSGDSP